MALGNDSNNLPRLQAPIVINAVSSIRVGVEKKKQAGAMHYRIQSDEVELRSRLKVELLQASFRQT